MKITHVHRPCDDREVWEEIRDVTLADDGKAGLLNTHQFASEEFYERMNRGIYDQRRIMEFLPVNFERTIHHPAEDGCHDVQLVKHRAEVNFYRRANDAKPNSNIEMVGRTLPSEIAYPATFEARAERTSTVKETRYWHLGSLVQVQQITKKVKEERITLLVVWEPLVDAGELDCLPDLQRMCPNLDVVIFYPPSKKAGVVVEGDDPDNWQDEFPVMGESEVPAFEVIVENLLLNKGIHVWAGMFESYKTIAAIELSSAILGNRPVFGQFKVNQQHPILYLCPDMAPELFQEYAKPFGLMQHKDFRWMKPGGETFHAIDSAVMERAVRGHILILDTMLDFAQIEKAFESGEWIKFFKRLRRLVNVCGCVAIVMLVHPTKTGAKSNTIDPSEYLKDSVTFGGKIDVGFGFSKVKDTSQVTVKRIKGRGFKKQQFSFTITYLDDDGQSHLDRGCFPVYLKPSEAGAPCASEKQQKIDFARTIKGSLQEKVDAIEAKFGVRHGRSTILKWLKEPTFDGDCVEEVSYQ